MVHSKNLRAPTSSRCISLSYYDTVFFESIPSIQTSWLFSVVRSYPPKNKKSTLGQPHHVPPNCVWCTWLGEVILQMLYPPWNEQQTHLKMGWVPKRMPDRSSPNHHNFRGYGPVSLPREWPWNNRPPTLGIAPQPWEGRPIWYQWYDLWSLRQKHHS